MLQWSLHPLRLSFALPQSRLGIVQTSLALLSLLIRFPRYRGTETLLRPLRGEACLKLWLKVVFLEWRKKKKICFDNLLHCSIFVPEVCPSYGRGHTSRHIGIRKRFSLLCRVSLNQAHTFFFVCLLVKPINIATEPRRIKGKRNYGKNRGIGKSKKIRRRRGQ